MPRHFAELVVVSLFFATGAAGVIFEAEPIR